MQIFEREDYVNFCKPCIYLDWGKWYKVDMPKWCPAVEEWQAIIIQASKNNDYKGVNHRMEILKDIEDIGFPVLKEISIG